MIEMVVRNLELRIILTAHLFAKLLHIIGNPQDPGRGLMAPTMGTSPHLCYYSYLINYLMQVLV